MKSISDKDESLFNPRLNKVYAKFDQLYLINKIISIVALVLFALTIVFIGLGQASMIPVYTPIISFTASIALFSSTYAVDYYGTQIGVDSAGQYKDYIKGKIPPLTEEKEEEEVEAI